MHTQEQRESASETRLLISVLFKPFEVSVQKIISFGTV